MSSRPSRDQPIVIPSIILAAQTRQPHANNIRAHIRIAQMMRPFKTRSDGDDVTLGCTVWRNSSAIGTRTNARACSTVAYFRFGRNYICEQLHKVAHQNTQQKENIPWPIVVDRTRTGSMAGGRGAEATVECRLNNLRAL